LYNKISQIELGQDKAQAIIDEITKAYERAGQSGKVCFSMHIIRIN
jgi:hypothetical protein